MIITVNGRELRVDLADNSSAQALADLVRNEELELAMQDYRGFEKVGSLPQRLPTNDKQITAQPGDVILYQGDKLTIYYGTNSWSLTRIGRITGVTADELYEALGDADVTITLRQE